MTEKRILIVDDDSTICMLLKRLLIFPACEVDFSYCGEDALRLVRNLNYDIVITDFHLPDMDGAELARQVRLDSPASRIVIISGNLADKHQLLLEAGISMYFQKPLNFRSFKGIIKEVLYS